MPGSVFRWRHDRIQCSMRGKVEAGPWGRGGQDRFLEGTVQFDE